MKHVATTLTLSYLRFLARLALKLHKPYIIGIAGSVGKSSARNALFAILKDQASTKMVGNSETGIPLGILGITPQGYSSKDWIKMLIRAPFCLNFLKNTTYLIAEMGIDDPYPPKNMAYLLTILQPQLAIDLNAEATHTMQFEKLLTPKLKNELSTDKSQIAFLRQKIADEDARMLRRAEAIVYNSDDKYIVNTLQTNRRGGAKTILTFGKDKKNTASFGHYRVSTTGTKIELIFDETPLSLTFPYLLPEVYQETLAAVLLGAKALGISLTDAKRSLEKNFTLPKSRASLLSGISDTIIIDSSYNASKSSVFAFLDMTLALKGQTARPVVFVLGDMRELGKLAKTEHEEVAEKLIGIADYLYLVGPLTREYVLPVVQTRDHRFKEIRWFKTSRNAGEYLKEHLPNKSLVLFKGSQNTIFLEEAVKYILRDKKDREKLCRQEPFWLQIKQDMLSFPQNW